MTYWPSGRVKGTYNSLSQSRDTQLSATYYDAKGRVSQQYDYGDGGVATHYSYSTSVDGSYTITTTTGSEGSDESLTSSKVHDIRTGKLLRSIDVNGVSTYHYYDSYGRPTRIKYPDNSSTVFNYSDDLTWAKVTEDGISKKTTVDSFGRLILTEYPTLTQQDSKLEYFKFDKVARVYTGTASSGEWTLRSSTTYDEDLRPLTKTRHGFGTTSYSYDNRHRTISVTDPIGRTTTKKVTLTRAGTLETTTFHPLNSVTLTYSDHFGDALKMKGPDGNWYHTQEDSNGEWIKGYHPSNSESLSGASLRSNTTLSINGAPTNVDIFDESGVKTKSLAYTYDDLGRITDLKVDGVSKEQITYHGTLSYRGRGNVRTIDNEHSQLKYEYDKMGRIFKERTLVKKAKIGTDLFSYYNNDGTLRATSLKAADGHSADRGTNTPRPLPDHLIEYKYDSQKRLSQLIFNGNDVARVTYNDTGTIHSLELGNKGNILKYSYDSNENRNSLLTQLVLQNSRSGIPDYSMTFDYDSIGRITHASYLHTWHEHDSPYFESPIKRDYYYTPKDELEKLVHSDSPASVIAYDANGNRVSFKKRNDRLAYTMHPNSNRLKMVFNAKDQQFELLHYDAEGNISSRSGSLYSKSIPQTYTYTYHGQLESVSKQYGDTVVEVARFEYDANKQRIAAHFTPHNGPESHIIYHWDNQGRIIAESKVDANGAMIDPFYVQYVYHGNNKLAMLRARPGSTTKELFFFVSNPQGTVTAIIDANGKILQRVQIDEATYKVRKKGIFPDEVNFTSKKYDPEIGLFYFNQRYFDPDLGRFITEDPAEQLLNPYVFSNNNPVMFADPDGEFFHLIPAIVGWATSAATLTAAAKGAVIAMNISTWGQVITQGQVVDPGAVISSTITGAIGGALSHGIGNGFADGSLAKTWAHGMSGAFTSTLAGGNPGVGFISGASADIVGNTIKGMDPGTQVAIVAASSGTISGIFGGSFTTGAIQGALVQTLNHLGYETMIKREIARELTALIKGSTAYISKLMGYFHSGTDMKLMGMSAGYDLRTGANIGAELSPSIASGGIYLDIGKEPGPIMVGFPAKSLGVRMSFDHRSLVPQSLGVSVGYSWPIPDMISVGYGFDLIQ
jgi:RHS repeat-associated protein